MNTLLYDIARCPGVPNLPDDPRAWTGAQGLLVPGTEPGQFVRGKASFDKQHPTVYAQVLAKDGDGADAIYWLDWLPMAQVTGMEDVENSESTERAYTVTMTGYEDPVVRTAHRQVWGGPGIDAIAMGFST